MVREEKYSFFELRRNPEEGPREGLSTLPPEMDFW
jgi:hypothetical protein